MNIPSQEDIMRVIKENHSAAEIVMTLPNNAMRGFNANAEARTAWQAGMSVQFRGDHD